MTVVPRNHRVKIVVCPLKNQPVLVRFRIPEKVHLPDFKIVDCPVLADGSVQCDRGCLNQLDMKLVSKPLNYLGERHC